MIKLAVEPAARVRVIDCKSLKERNIASRTDQPDPTRCGAADETVLVFLGQFPHGSLSILILPQV
jgi:hypothetical protein